MIERLNRTYKASYRKTNAFDTIDGANYDLALWVAYYNFLRPHKHNNTMCSMMWKSYGEQTTCRANGSFSSFWASRPS